jgi:hypothetical protein
MHTILSTRRMALLVLAALLALGVTSPTADEGWRPGWRPTLTGTWYFSSVIAPGATLPGLVTYHDDGTAVYSDAIMFGGIPQVPMKITPFHAVWQVTGRNRFGGTALGLIFDPVTNAMIGFARARSNLRFDTDLNHIVGTIFGEMVLCSTTFTCPDPTDPSLVWTPTADPVHGMSVSLSRLSRVPAGPLP